MTNYKFGKGSLTILDNPYLHPQIKIFMTEVLKVSTVDISIIDGCRISEQQQILFLKGVTELDGINELSDHQIEKYDDNLGRAIDIIPYVPQVKYVNIWDVDNAAVNKYWCEIYRAILKVDRLWKLQGIDVGLELGLTYNIGGGRDYPHISFKKL